MQPLRFFSLWTSSLVVRSFKGFVGIVTLLGALFGLSLSAHGQTIPNPIFISNGFYTVFPGYASGNGGGIIGWMPSSASFIGLNPVLASGNFSYPFADNGALPAGPNVAFIQGDNNTNTLSTTITGLTVGRVYAVSFRANSRAATGTPNPTWSLNGGAFVPFTAAPPVGGSNPYYTNTGYFTATNTTAALALRNGTAVDTTVLLGGFSIGLALGTTNLLVGPDAGSNSVVLPMATATNAWTASTNATWLHLSAGYQSGTGNANVIFSFDANPDVTRVGTLTIAGQTVTITQAGSTYVAAGSQTSLGTTGLNEPLGVAVDRAGNVYFSSEGQNTIEEWTATNNTVSTLISSSAGVMQPYSVAVDGAGNIYFSDTGNNTIKKWIAASNLLTTLVPASAGLNGPYGIAVDGPGNVYIADLLNNVVKKWTATNGVVTTLVPSAGLNGPYDVAVDSGGNVYIADEGNHSIKKWTATNGVVSTLITNVMISPSGVAVDGSGNIYIADLVNRAIDKWTAASNTLTTLAFAGLNNPAGVTVDAADNVYIADTINNGILELPYAFVDPSTKTESTAAGSDALATVLPATANLLAPFAPTSDSGWLTVGTITNGVVSFSFATNTGATRMGNITVLAQQIGVTQAGTFTSPTDGELNVNGFATTGGTLNLNLAYTPIFPTTLTVINNTSGNPIVGMFDNMPQGGTVYLTNNGAVYPFVVNYLGGDGNDLTLTLEPIFALGTPALLVGPASGSNSVVLAALGPNLPWTAAPNVDWLHLSPANQSGTGSTNVIFSFDANSGGTRTGTLTIAGGTLTVTQAGSNYVSTTSYVTLLTDGQNFTFGLGVDTNGNVYFTDTTSPGSLKLWNPTNNTVTPLVSGGSSQISENPRGLAIDPAGFIYIADTGNYQIDGWQIANSNFFVRLPYSSGFNQPYAVAVDLNSNIFVADWGNNAIKEFTTTIVSGLNQPSGVATDAAGNVYYADSGNNKVGRWTAADSSVTTLVSSGITYPQGMTVDGSGNVYFTDATGRGTVKKWSPANGLTTPISSGLDGPQSVAVDGNGNIYATDSYDNPETSVKELAIALVDPTPRFENPFSGSDSLPPVLPTTENLLTPFNPTSDQSWLEISGVTNGVISYTFTANDSGAARTANISVLGQVIPVTQSVLGEAATLTVLPGTAKGVVQFTFPNLDGATFTVLSTTNLLLALPSWTVVGSATNTGPGQYEFISVPTTNDMQRYYTVRSP